MAFDPTTATLETKETTSSGDFDPSTAKPDDIKTTSLGAGAASAAEAVAATPGVLAGARAAMALTPPVLPIVGPFAKPIAGIAGGVAGGILASMGINSLEQLSDSVFGTNIAATRKQQQQKHPIASTVGQVAGGSLNPWMRPGLPSTLGEAAFGGGVMAVVGGAQRAAHGEKVFDPTAMAIDVGTGIFTKPTAMGQRLLGHKAPTGASPDTDPNKPKIPDNYKRPEYRAKELVANIPKEYQRGEEVSGFPTTDKDVLDFARLVSRDDHEKQKTANPEEYLKQKQELDARYGEGFADKIENKEFYRELINKQLPPKPPKEQKEELTAWMEKAKQVSAERDSVSPLTEAAIRNKETGQVERHGPKHDQERKEATKATHEEGFVTERGTFLTREQAVEHAKRTGQIPEDHVLENPPGEQPGLHSGDLRTAGDERFQITDSQPAGIAKPDKPLLTRAEHVERIEQLEYALSVDEQLTENTAHTLTPEELAKENKYLADQQTKIDNLRKSIPEPVVKDKANLTAEETHDILVGAKTVKEGLQRIVDGKYGNKLERWLAKKLLSMESVRLATLNINTRDIGLAPSDVGIIAGEYFSADHSVHMYSTGELQVFLHEAIHAATSRLLFEGKHAAAKALNKLYEHAFKTASPEYYKAWKDGILTNEEAFNKYEQKQKALGKESHYGLRNVDEFLTETFTQDSFRNDFLKGMSGVQGIKSGSAWEGFKKIIHEMLGATKPQETAFIDQILEQGSKLMDSKSKTALGGAGTGGTEATFRNYVAFDDSRLKQNLVSFASKGKGKDDTAAPPVVDVISDKVDRTKTDPRDVPNEKELLEIAADIYDKYGEVETTEFFKGYQEYKKTWLEPVAETEKFVGMNLRNKAANERIIYNEKEKMLKGITNPERRVAIAEAVDRGDLSGLSAEEVAVANHYSELVKDIGDRAVEQGVVKGLLENYVTHVLEWAGAPKGAREEFLNSMFGKGSGDPSMHGMDVSSKFAKERKFKTFADLELYLKDFNKGIAEAGKSKWRLELKTKDIAEIYKEYALSMEKAVENKKLVDNLKQVRNVAGETLIKEVNKDNPLPHGWKMMDSPQFAGYAVHPNMAPALKFVFDAGPGQLMGALGWLSGFTKRLNVIGSFFHAKSLMEVISSTGIPIWTPFKETVVLPLVEKTGKALFGKDVQLSAISKAVEQFHKGGVGDNVDKWIREDGLILEMPDDVSKGILTETGKFADSMIGKYGPKTRVLEKSLSTVEKYTLGLFDKFTWDYLHTGGKLMVADAYLDKARIAAAKEGKPFDEATQRKEIARFVNDSFGGLNWFDAATSARQEFARRMADSTRGTGIASKALDNVSEIKSRASMAAFSPEGRRGLQIALFAPDWTISTIRAFSAALPKELNPTKWHPVEGIKGMMTPTTKADYARLYQFKTALTYFTLLNAINMMTANRPIWENKDPTRIEWPDGTSMQAMKHAMEPYHWIMDPDKTLSNKLGFIPKAAVVGIAGTEYASPMAQKLVDPSAAGRLKAVAGMALPFQVSAAATAPEGEGAKRAVLGTLGFPVYGGTKEQKKEARAEREKLLKKAAKDYRDKAKERGWEQ